MQLVRDYAGPILSLAGRFGLIPADRTHLSVGGGNPPPADPERLLS